MAETRSSIDSVASILSDFSENHYEGSVVQQIDDAKAMIDRHVLGRLYKDEIDIAKLLKHMIDEAIGNGRCCTAATVLMAESQGNPADFLVSIAEAWLFTSYTLISTLLCCKINQNH
jgi:hypothetical protein